MAEKKICVKQVRSGTGHLKNQKETLKALGLGRIGKCRVHAENAALLGMLRTVSHLVEIEYVK